QASTTAASISRPANSVAGRIATASAPNARTKSNLSTAAGAGVHSTTVGGTTSSGGTDSSGGGSTSGGASSSGTATVNAEVGHAMNGNFASLSATSPGLCAAGTVVNFAPTTNGWTWSCQGTGTGAADDSGVAYNGYASSAA